MINYLYGNFPVKALSDQAGLGFTCLDTLILRRYTLFTLGEAMPESPGIPGDPLNLIWLMPAEERK
jgi:hypothetical protein